MLSSVNSRVDVHQVRAFERERVKRQTIQQRRLLDRKQAG